MALVSNALATLVSNEAFDLIAMNKLALPAVETKHCQTRKKPKWNLFFVVFFFSFFSQEFRSCLSLCESMQTLSIFLLFFFVSFGKNKNEFLPFFFYSLSNILTHIFKHFIYLNFIQNRKNSTY